MYSERNKELALALGYVKLNDTWLNSWGASFPGNPPDFYGNVNSKHTIINHFTGFGAEIDGRKEKFFAEYKESMTAEEISKLALKVLKEKRR